jgi:LysR family transcriptional regulator, hydrogen peroxide-inducible genes activator
MNLQQLEYLIAVDKTGSFSKAADLCFVTQATLSTMVKRLEEELDIVLFDRSSSPVLTTDAARPVIELAQKAVAAVNGIREVSGLMKGKVEGRIKLGVIPTVANSVLPLIMKSLLVKYPDLVLEIREITTQSILKQLKSGEIDAGLLSTPVKEGDGFVEQVLYYEALFVYGKPVSNVKKFVMPKEIVKEKIWLLEEGHCLREQFVNLCSLKKKRMGDQLIFESNSFDTLLNMADEFGGLTVLPELYVRSMSPERKKKVFQFVAPYPVREISLMVSRPFVKSRLVQVLADEIKGVILPLLITESIKKSDQVIVRS